MIAFSGVRSSWLILARKRDLARLALFGCIARLDQRLLVALALGDVARHGDDVGRVALAPGPPGGSGSRPIR